VPQPVHQLPPFQIPKTGTEGTMRNHRFALAILFAATRGVAQKQQTAGFLPWILASQYGPPAHCQPAGQTTLGRSEQTISLYERKSPRSGTNGVGQVSKQGPEDLVDTPEHTRQINLYP